MRFNFSAFSRDVSGEDTDSVESVTPLRRSPVPGNSGTSVLTSPITAASGSTGGDASSDRSASTANTPVRLVWVKKANQICCGVIGNNSKRHFCTHPIGPDGACPIKGHLSKKFAVEDDTWYVKSSKSDNRQSAFLGISCPNVVVTRPEDRTAFLSEKKPHEVWRALFSSLKSRRDVIVLSDSSTENDSVSQLETPTAADLTRAVDALNLNTPNSASVGSAVKSVTDDYADLPDLIPFNSWLWDDDDSDIDPENESWNQAVRSIIGEWGKVGDNFNKLKSMFLMLGKAHNALSDGVIQDFNLIEGKANLVDNKILLLRERIGQHAQASEGGTKSVWDAIAEMQEDIKGTQVLLSDMETTVKFVSTDAGMINSYKSILDEFKADYEMSMGSLKEALKTIDRRLTRSEQGRPNGGLSLSGSSAFGGASDSTRDPLIQSKIDELKKQVDALKLAQKMANDRSINHVSFASTTQGLDNQERERAQAWEGGFGDLSQLLSTPGNTNTTSGAADLPGGATTIREMAIHFGNELGYLQQKIKALETPHQGQAVQVNGHKFASQADCKAFVKRTKLDVGLCTDFATTLINMGDKDLTGRGFADRLYSAQRTSTSARLNDLMAAMGKSRPEKLYSKGGKGDYVLIADGFGAIPSPKDWYGTGVDGIKQTLTAELQYHLAGLEGALAGQYGEGPELARGLILRVQGQWNSFVGFIEQAQTKLVQAAKFSEKTAWKLIGRYGVAVFEAMRPYRAATIALDNPESLEHQAAVLWAVLQCHRVMSEFIEVQFEGHPAIVREMSLFMLTERVDPLQFDRLLQENKDLSRDVVALTKRVKTLEDQQNSLKRSLDNLQNTVNQMKKKT